MSYLNGKLASLIRSYTETLSPFCPNPNYRRNLDRLAEKLQKLCSRLTLDDKFYCYVYLDPRYPGNYEYVLPSGKVVKFKHRPFYVGKGCSGTRDRAYSHLKEASVTARSNPKLNTIRKITRLALQPIIKITHTRESEALALALEIDLIAGIGRKDVGGGPLTNLTNGGDGGSGVVRTEASILKLKSTLASRSQEEVASTYARRAPMISHALRNRTQEQLETAKHKRRSIIANRSTERSEAVRQKHIQAYTNKSEREKQCIRDRQSLGHLRRTEKQTDESNAKRAKTREGKEAEICAAVKAGHPSRDPNRKEAWRASISKAAQNKSPEARSLSSLRGVARRSPEERSLSVLRGWATRRLDLSL